MKWSQTLSTDFKSGLTSKFGTFTKVLYRGSHSTDPALKALDVIIDSGKTRRVLYDSTKKAILFEDLSNTLKAEQMGILWKAGYTNFNPILKPWVPLILRDGSNLKAIARGFASKVIKAFDNDTAKVLEDIVLPNNLDDISVLSDTNKGFKFNMQFKGKTVEVRIMNPTGVPYNYSEGYMRIYDPITKTSYAADGSWLPENALNYAKTHFNIVGFK